jgi:hypothetical protein
MGLNTAMVAIYHAVFGVLGVEYVPPAANTDIIL